MGRLRMPGCVITLGLLLVLFWIADLALRFREIRAAETPSPCGWAEPLYNLSSLDNAASIRYN